MGERHLIAEYFLLHVPGRMIIVIIETDLAPGDDFAVSGQGGESVQVSFGNFFGIVRMDTDRGVDPIMRFRIRNGRIELFRARSGSNGKES